VSLVLKDLGLNDLAEVGSKDLGWSFLTDRGTFLSARFDESSVVDQGGSGLT